MTAALTQIKIAFENEGMLPEEIADDQELDVVAVKSGLMQCSAKYRKLCGVEGEDVSRVNYNEDEQERVKEVILNIALGADDDNTRLKAAIYVRDDAKGRKDVVKNVQHNTQFNILDFNNMLQQARMKALNV